jgi:nicotinamidase-related amidase
MNYTEPELRKSALLTIDMQRDFSLPGSPAEIAGTTGVVPNIVRLVRAYRDAGLPIVHIIRFYLPDGSNVDLCRRQSIQDGKAIVRPGSQGAHLVVELLPQPEITLDYPALLNGGIQSLGRNEVVIYKPRWGAFYRTPLHGYFAQLCLNTLVVCGCNFPNCPRTTIYEASERDYKLVLVEDAVSGIYLQGKQELENIGVRLWSAEGLIERINSDSDKLGVPTPQ